MANSFNNSKLLILFGILVYATAAVPSCTQKDFHYWRDYYNEIPPDAFVAANDSDGTPIYVGFSHFYGRGVYISIIKPNQAAYFVFGTTKVTTKFTKILCSTNNSLFKWIPTDVNKLRLLTDHQLIKAGENDGHAYAIVGRANIQGKTIIGRIADEVSNSGLIIHDTTFKQIKVNAFEVLTYNC